MNPIYCCNQKSVFKTGSIFFLILVSVFGLEIGTQCNVHNGLIWSSVVEAQTVDSKVEALHKTIERILDTHGPKRSVKQRQNKPQWITGSVIKTSRAKNKAYNNDQKSWKALNALSQRMLRSSKHLRVDEHLNKDQNTKQWSEIFNLLTHKTSNQNNNNRLSIDGEFLTTQDFNNNINDYYLTVG